MSILFIVSLLLMLLGVLTIQAALIAWCPWPRALQWIFVAVGCFPLAQAAQNAYGLWPISTYGHGGGPEAMIGVFLWWTLPWLVGATLLCFTLAAATPALHSRFRARLLPELRPYRACDD